VRCIIDRVELKDVCKVMGVDPDRVETTIIEMLELDPTMRNEVNLNTLGTTLQRYLETQDRRILNELRVDHGARADGKRLLQYPFGPRNWGVNDKFRRMNISKPDVLTPGD